MGWILLLDPPPWIPSACSVRGGGAAEAALHPAPAISGRRRLPIPHPRHRFTCPGCSVASPITGGGWGTGAVPRNRLGVRCRGLKSCERSGGVPETAGEGSAEQPRGRAGRTAGRWCVCPCPSTMGTAGPAFPCPLGWPRWVPLLRMAVDVCRCVLNPWMGNK